MADAPGDGLTGKPFRIADLLDYQAGAIVSRTPVDEESGTVTVFAFDETQRLSEHSAPHETILQVVDGTAEVEIDGEPHRVEAGESIVLPADVPHSVDAVTRFEMLLTMIR